MTIWSDALTSPVKGYLGRFLSHAGLALLVLISSACSVTQRPASPDNRTPLPAWLRDPLPREYILETGDVCDVKFFYHPEFNETELSIRTDGKITAQLVGDVVARGRTPSELAADLVDRYVQVGVRQPSISVFLRKSVGLRVFVGGEVNNPGMIPHDGQLTLSRAILQAGGPKATAALRSVVVLRDSRKGNDADPLFAVVDLKNLLAGGQDPVLQPYDVVFLPKSTIATLNQFVEQYIVKMIPGQLNAGFEYTIGQFTNIGPIR